LQKPFSSRSENRIKKIPTSKHGDLQSLRSALRMDGYSPANFSAFIAPPARAPAQDP
jgi:hypothetical protein